MAGMMKEVETDATSAMRPMSSVPTAPPIGVIMRKEEAILTLRPWAPTIVMAKMVGNMMASKA